MHFGTEKSGLNGEDGLNSEGGLNFKWTYNKAGFYCTINTVSHDYLLVY